MTFISASESDRYQVRYSLTGLVGFAILVSAALATAGGYIVVSAPDEFKLGGLLLFLPGACGVVITTWVLVTRRIALRADENGIFLGGDPLRPSSTSVQVPWDQVEQIIIWRRPAITADAAKRQLRLWPVIQIGIVRRSRAEEYTSFYRDLASFGAPVTGAAGIVKSAGGYHLNTHRLEECIGQYAPSVIVTNATG
jgi:hypothetical protein